MAEDDLPELFLFSDEPVHSHTQDALQLQGFSRTIAAAAVGSPGPFTIGIFAGWGQGKTSILRQARSLIDSAPNHQHAVTAWINAWRFEQEEHPIVPIILSILDGIYQKLKGRNPTDPEERFLARAHRALSAIAYGFGFKGKIAVPLVGEVEAEASIKDMLERYEKLAPKPDPLVEKSLYYHAYEILDGILDGEEFKKPPFPKIVVFIDDLDRCLPDKALKVFESIKLVLSQRGFVFVLAVDRDVIDAFLTKRYRTEFGLGEEHHHGEQYMDKIIQLALHVPNHEGRFEDYIKNLIGAEGAISPNLLASQLKDDERKVFAGLVKPLAAGTDRNPRSLIRILNRLLTDKFLWDQLPDSQKQGKAITSAEELLRFAAVSRIVENSLGIARYRELVRSQELCQGLIDFVCDYGTSDPFPSAKDRPLTKSRAPIERERKIILHIEGSPALREMLQSDDGKAWLSDKDKRQVVENFLDTTRQLDNRSGGNISAELIKNEIRRALGLDQSIPLTDAHFSALTALDFMAESLTDLYSLPELPALDSLVLDYTEVRDLTPLLKCRGLKLLSLSGTPVSNLSPLSDLSDIHTLYLDSTQAADISPLNKLSKLHTLLLDGTKVEDLSPLLGRTNLKTLSLTGTSIRNCAMLSHFTSLTNLRIDHTTISDVSPLARLSNLLELDISKTPAASDSSQVGFLEEKLPNCEITF